MSVGRRKWCGASALVVCKGGVMVLQWQKDMVRGSLLYWIYKAHRSGLTLPFLGAMSELTPREVLEVFITEPLPEPDTNAHLSFCGEIVEPLVVVTGHGAGGYMGKLSVNTHALISRLLLSLDSSVEEVIEAVLVRAERQVARGWNTRKYHTREGMTWTTLEQEEKEEWRNNIVEYISTNTRSGFPYPELYDEDLEYDEDEIDDSQLA